MNFSRSLLAPALLIPLLLSGCSAPDEIAMIDCSKSVIRPTEITTYCADAGQIIQNIKWSKWNEDEALGTGVAYTNNCEPSCVAGQIIKNAVKLKLNAPMDTNEGLLYTNLEISYLEPLENHPMVEELELPTAFID